MYGAGDCCAMHNSAGETAVFHFLRVKCLRLFKGKITSGFPGILLRLYWLIK
jgi:hypothetical protein